jgi:hypothetical protein
MKPNSLLVRTKTGNLSERSYEIMLVATIEQEFEHNVAQQICLRKNAGMSGPQKNTAIQSAK